MSVPSYLPVLRGWKSCYALKTLEVLQPGQSLPLINESRPGWFGCGRVATSSPFMVLHIEVDESKGEVSPYGCQLLGLNSPSDHLYCSVYNPILPIFNLMFAPAFQLPFRKLVVYVLNPTKDPLGNPTTPLSVIKLEAGYWIIDDVTEFKKSVREILAPL